MRISTIGAEQLFEQGVARFNKREYAQSLFLLQECLKVRPDHADAMHMRGVVRLRMREPFDALLHFEAALAHRPEAHEIWNNRGIAFADIGAWENSIASYRKSAEIFDTVDPHMGLGALFCHINKLDEGEAEFRRAIEMQPDLQDAHLKRGVALLGLGRWDEAWPEYAWRWFKNPYPPRAQRVLAPWEGEDLTDAGIVLYQEQGFGDVIMGLRFVHQLVDERAPRKVCLEVHPLVYRLAKSIPNAHVIIHGDTYPPGMVYSAALFDVAQHLGASPATLWTRPAYLRSLDTSRRSYFREKVAALGPGLKVGVCWNAGRRPLQPETEGSAQAKSLNVKMLGHFIPMEGARFVSLQLPQEDIPANLPIVDFMDEIEDFADTAALMESLDLVITVDTSVAHLAGALGRPCWCLVRNNGYWPWLLPNLAPTPNTSIWYSSMTLYRQPDMGDWQPALERVARDLGKLLEQRAVA